MPDKQYRERMEFLNEVLDLQSFITSPVRTLSLGQRMRADIAASMLHNPKVLFLDEPTIGLDVVVKDNIRKAIQKINAEEGTTVILTTHDLSDIELLCDRIVMIDKGNLVYDGQINNLKHKYGQMRELCFEMKNSDDLLSLDYKGHFTLDEDDLSIESDGVSATIRFNSDKASVQEVLKYTLAKIDVRDINVKDADIEEIIRRIYKEGV